MSLLDELKHEATRLNSSTSEQAASHSPWEAHYHKELRPRMLKLLAYLNDLTSQLKLVAPDVRANYRIPGLGQVKRLRQGNYLVNADSVTNPRRIRLKFSCVAAQEMSFSVSPKGLADETRGFLHSHHMQFSEWPIRDAEQRLSGVNFQVTPKVEVVFMFQIAPEQYEIEMLTSNFEKFGIRRYTYGPERIDDEWLDNLGNYVLRRHDKLHSLDISDSTLVNLRERLAVDKLERETGGGADRVHRPGQKRGKGLFGRFLHSPNH
ncbi:hypothetical protein Rifp1Sym_cc00050 [endosymbiont of Riftia pachyptila (vent Ph05)]|jgi:hypothetical protein|nr:hypothetical protein Rifp1Sym_cc00050 [endosymbiont of Riftia pachyptila (vent Ph05)]